MTFRVFCFQYMNASQEEPGTVLINISNTSEQEKIPYTTRLVYNPR